MAPYLDKFGNAILDQEAYLRMGWRRGWVGIVEPSRLICVIFLAFVFIVL